MILTSLKTLSRQLTTATLALWVAAPAILIAQIRNSAPGPTTALPGLGPATVALTNPATPASSNAPQLGPPAEVSPGVIRFAYTATAPERGATDPARVIPLAPGIGQKLPPRETTLAPLAPAELESIRREDAAQAMARNNKRLRVGIGRILPEPVLINDQIPVSAWAQLSGGWHVWSARITSPGATGLRLHVENLQLPPGVLLLVYNPEQPAPATPVSAETLYGQRDVWMESVLAETVAIECQVPPTADPASVVFSITGVSHFYRPLVSGPVEKTLGCELDVTCYPAWAKSASGVARMYFVDSGSAYLCTGCLLNTTPSTFVSYFLTANHCIGNQAVASTLELYWLYQTSTCNGVAPVLSSVPHTTGGADYLAGSSVNDFTFLRLHQAPPGGASFLGWSTASPASGESLACIHHPGPPPDDFKRICFGNSTPSDPDFWSMEWNNGTTEEGSSGSPLFNSSQQVIGQLYGGNLACPPGATDDYGRFDVTYQTIRSWLEPVPPANDFCAGAVALTNNAYYSQSTDSATDDVEPCSGTVSKGVWFTFTPSVLGTATVDAYPSDFNTALEVFNGNCGALQTLGCRNYAANAFSFICLPGTTYHICAGGYLGDSGHLQIRAAAVTSPVSILGIVGSWDFGSVVRGQTVTHTLILTNSGNASLNIQSITLPPGFSGAWSGTIAARGFHVLTVVFAPTAQASYSGTVLISHNATIGPTSISITGTAYYPLTKPWTLWWQHTNGTLALWSMTGTNLTAATRLNPSYPGPGWMVAATMDFNQDGQTDLLFQHPRGAVAAWLMSGSNFQRSAYLTPGTVDPKWQVAATADLNGDGRTDILWQHTDGWVAVWLMNGLVRTQATRLNPGWTDPAWHMAGAADFNNDTQPDLLWRHNDGRIAVWFMNGTNRTQSAYLNPSWADPSWKIVGTADLNQDGHAGILWRQDIGTLAYWQMDGTNLVHSGRLNPSWADPVWRVVGPR